MHRCIFFFAVCTLYTRSKKVAAFKTSEFLNYFLHNRSFNGFFHKYFAFINNKAAAFAYKYYVVLYLFKKVSHTGIRSATGSNKQNAFFLKFFYKFCKAFWKCACSVFYKCSVNIGAYKFYHVFVSPKNYNISQSSIGVLTVQMQPASSSSSLLP